MEPLNNTNVVDEVEALRAECKKLAGYLMNGYVFVHERIIEEVDKALETYIGGEDYVLPPLVIKPTPAIIVHNSDIKSINVRTEND